MATNVNLSDPPRFEDILADQVAYFASQSARVTDFNPGSVVRTILEIVAQVQERRDVAVWSTLNRAIDEAVFDAWGFARRQAEPATGQLTLYLPVENQEPFVIPQGTKFRVPDSVTQIYEAISPANNPDTTWGWLNDRDNPGTIWTVDTSNYQATVNVRAVNVGTIGNVGPNQITQPMAFIPNVAAVRNLRALNNGRDIATDADRRADFAAFIQSLPRGTVQALEFGAKIVVRADPFGIIQEKVQKVHVYETTTSHNVTTVDAGLQTFNLGRVGVFIHNGVGGTTAALRDQAQQVIDGYTDNQGIRHDGWRAAGLKADVYRATEQPITTAITIEVAKGYQLAQTVALAKQAMIQVFDALNINQKLNRSDILYALKHVPGVLDADITTPSSWPVTPTDVNYLLTLNSISGTATQGTQTLNIVYPTPAVG